jgi:hypothetical protein
MVANLNSFLYALLVLFVASSHNPTADETLRAPANSGLQLRQQKGIAISGPSKSVRSLPDLRICPQRIPALFLKVPPKGGWGAPDV